MEAELALSMFVGLSEVEMQLMVVELSELYPVAVETLGISGPALNASKTRQAAESFGSDQ